MKLIKDLHKDNKNKEIDKNIIEKKAHIQSKILIENKDTIRGYSTRLNIKTRNIIILFLVLALTITAIGNGFRWFTFTFEMMTQPIEAVLPWKPFPYLDNWWMDGWNAIRQVVYKFGGLAFMWAGTPIMVYNLIMINKIRTKWDKFEDVYIPILNKEYIQTPKQFSKEEDILPFMSILIHKTLNKFLMDGNVYNYLIKKPRGMFKKFRSWRRNQNFSHYKISLELEKYYKRTFLIQDIESVKHSKKQGEENENKDIRE